MDDHYHITKQAVLTHVQKLFQEIEEEMAISHQEKFALLEDAFESASDADELRVAFEQWFQDHADDVEFDMDADDLWDSAINQMDEDDEDDDSFFDDEDDEEEDDDEDDDEDDLM